MWTFARAAGGDWPAVEALLRECGLPTDGASAHLAAFHLARDAGILAAVAGLERYGDVALLRSVATRSRSIGLGQELVRQVLDAAHADGVRRVVLLTTTAAAFFERFGFRAIRREEVPAGVRASQEFRGACPDSATAMLLDVMRPPILVRRAALDDAAAIRRIYNQGIEDRSTLETEPRTDQERRAWLAARDWRHPVTVGIRLGAVVGFLSLNPFNPRPAYRFVADFGIYVERQVRGHGVGRSLLEDGIRRARALGYHKLVLTTFPTLVRAQRLYERLGFRYVGDYREQGMLDGAWVDTRLMELIL